MNRSSNKAPPSRTDRSCRGNRLTPSGEAGHLWKRPYIFQNGTSAGATVLVGAGAGIIGAAAWGTRLIGAAAPAGIFLPSFGGPIGSAAGAGAAPAGIGAMLPPPQQSLQHVSQQSFFLWKCFISFLRQCSFSQQGSQQESQHAGALQHEPELQELQVLQVLQVSQQVGSQQSFLWWKHFFSLARQPSFSQQAQGSQHGLAQGVQQSSQQSFLWWKHFFSLARQPSFSQQGLQSQQLLQLPQLPPQHAPPLGAAATTGAGAAGGAAAGAVSTATQLVNNRNATFILDPPFGEVRYRLPWPVPKDTLPCGPCDIRAFDLCHRPDRGPTFSRFARIPQTALPPRLTPAHPISRIGSCGPSAPSCVHLPLGRIVDPAKRRGCAWTWRARSCCVPATRRPRRMWPGPSSKPVGKCEGGPCPTRLPRPTDRHW